MSGKKSVYWVEVPFRHNEVFVEFLILHGGGDELKRPGKMDTNGKPHDVWCITGTQITWAMLRDMKKRIPELKLFRARSKDTDMSEVTLFLENKKTDTRLQSARSLVSS